VVITAKLKYNDTAYVEVVLLVNGSFLELPDEERLLAAPRMS